MQVVMTKGGGAYVHFRFLAILRGWAFVKVTPRPVDFYVLERCFYQDSVKMVPSVFE